MALLAVGAVVGSGDSDVGGTDGFVGLLSAFRLGVVAACLQVTVAH